MSDGEGAPPPDHYHLPVVPVGGGVVGAGVVSVLDRLRKVQQRHRPGGMFIRLPDRTHRFFEQRLRVGDGGEVVAAADAALVVVAEECRRAGVGPPIITGITVGSESVELLVDLADGLANLDWLDGRASAFKAGSNSSVIVHRPSGACPHLYRVPMAVQLLRSPLSWSRPATGGKVWCWSIWNRWER